MFKREKIFFLLYISSVSWMPGSEWLIHINITLLAKLQTWWISIFILGFVHHLHYLILKKIDSTFRELQLLPSTCERVQRHLLKRIPVQRHLLKRIPVQRHLLKRIPVQRHLLKRIPVQRHLLKRIPQEQLFVVNGPSDRELSFSHTELSGWLPFYLMKDLDPGTEVLVFLVILAAIYHS